MLRGVEHRHDADVDQPLLPERRIVADRDDFVMQLGDDILRRAGRRDEAEIDRREVGKPSSLKVGTSGNSGERVSE